MPMLTEQGRRRLSLWVLCWSLLEAACDCVVLAVCMPVLVRYTENAGQPHLLWWPVALLASSVSATSGIPACGLVALTSWRMRSPHRAQRRPSSEAALLGAAVFLAGSSLQLFALVETVLHSCRQASSDKMRSECVSVDIVNGVSLFIQLVLVVSVRLLQTSTMHAMETGDVTATAPGWVLFPPSSSSVTQTDPVEVEEEWTHLRTSRQSRHTSSSESLESADMARIEPSNHREMLLTKKSQVTDEWNIEEDSKENGEWKSQRKSDGRGG